MRNRGDGSPGGAAYRTSKRLFDVTIGGAALLLTAPVILVVALLVLLILGRPVWFTQPRVGLRGRTFTLLKFRTMRDARDADGTLLPDEERLPRFGRLLRSTSLDELPGLFNVLRGDMSLVGPRPLLLEYLPLYSARQARRHDVLPGITGWAQVNGRNLLSWPERLEMDVWYVEHRSFLLDLRILALTVLRVMSRSGISAPGQATMRSFRGEG